jgi:hypothetical protein
VSSGCHAACQQQLLFLNGLFMAVYIFLPLLLVLLLFQLQSDVDEALGAPQSDRPAPQ